MKDRTLVFDIDGTLLESALRQHACYSEILRALGEEPWERERYWTAKRAGASNVAILNQQKFERVLPEFQSRWRELIECDRLLELDTVLPDVKETLRSLTESGWTLVAATLRQRLEGIRAQLERLGIDMHFRAVLVTPHAEGARGKAERVNAYFGRPAFWIGDTEVDIDAARIAGCDAIAVTTGIRSRARLEEFRPARIIDRLGETMEILSAIYGACEPHR